MLAEGAGDMLLVEMKKECLEWHGIELQQERRNPNEREDLRMKRSMHL